MEDRATTVVSREHLVKKFHEHIGQPVGASLAHELVKLVFQKVEKAPHLAALNERLEKVTNDSLMAVAKAMGMMAKQCLGAFMSQKEDERDMRLLRAHLLIEECGEVCEALAKRDEALLLKELVDVEYIALGTGVTFGLPMDAGFDEVHSSNMTKDAGAWLRRDGDKGKGPNYVKADMAKVMKAHQEKKDGSNS